MLIRFTVSNYLSFNEEVEFSMIPGKCRSHPHHLVKGSKRSDISVLRAGVIYGANASGKSNLIKAMAFARSLVVNGIRPNKPIPRIHFKFDVSCVDKPSHFEFEFKRQKKAYAYGFELDSQKIQSEWLYEITKASQKKLFERHTAETGETAVEFGNIRFRDKNEQKLVHLMKPRKNQLFLTQSIETGVRQFEQIMSWFQRLTIILPGSPSHGLEFRADKENMIRDSLVNFLGLFDTGISGISLKALDLKDDIGVFPADLQAQLGETLEIGEETILSAPNNTHYLVSMNEHGQLEVFKLMTHHKAKGSSEEALLEINDESDGTRRLMDLIPALHMVLNEDRVCIIDELDRSLHPKLSCKILEVFLDNSTNRESQLIVTTHESSLLNLKLMRRDEIWFLEKNKDDASIVYSLEEFIPRYDHDVRKGYLMGRFGGIPILNDITKMGWVVS